MASQWWKARKRQKCGIYAPAGRQVWTFIIAQITICYTRTFLRGTYYVTRANWSGSMVHRRGEIVFACSSLSFVDQFLTRKIVQEKKFHRDETMSLMAERIDHLRYRLANENQAEQHVSEDYHVVNSNERYSIRKVELNSVVGQESRYYSRVQL